MLWFWPSQYYLSLAPFPYANFPESGPRGTPFSKQREYLYRIQLSITPPPCLPIVLELM